MSASPSWYRMALVLALIAALSQVALGGVVRVTGSGDACPDWPLCHGQIIPPLDLGIWLEFGHRLSASVLGVLVLLARGLAWRKDPADRVSVGAVNAALALVVVASLLGGVTVLTELAWWARLIHLVLAELVVACLAVAWLAGPGGAPQATDPARAGAQSLNRTVGLATLGMMLGAIVFGSYMVGFNYGAACTSWPMCQGIRIPEGTAYLVNMGHRVTTIAIAAPLIWLCWRAWRAGTGAPRVRLFAALAAVCLAAAVLLGALVIWDNFSVPMRSLHLTVATLLWGSTVALVAALSDPFRFRPRWSSE